MTHRRSRSNGQALVEFALLTPAMILFVLLTVDLGRAYWQAIDASGAARAGARMGIISDTSDIGSAVRDEPNSGIPNTVAAWGNQGPGQANGVCTTATATCGDPNGCAQTSFAGAQIACFTVRSCTLSGGGDLGTCTSYGVYGQRPASAGGHAVQVTVVIKFIAATPALAQLIGPGGNLYLTRSAVAEVVYF
jgi:Flp pilus assembly protein TadG